jgi:hypothetical protein
MFVNNWYTKCGIKQTNPLPTPLRPVYHSHMSRWVTQINIRLDSQTNEKLEKEAERSGTTRSQIAREAIRKELERRVRGRKLERTLEVIGE